MVREEWSGLLAEKLSSPPKNGQENFCIKTDSNSVKI